MVPLLEECFDHHQEKSFIFRILGKNPSDAHGQAEK